jgi:arylsulfatase
MSIWVARLRYWGGAVLVGIGIAVAAGLCEAMPPARISIFEENNYLGYRLYATAARLLAQTVDRWLPETIGLALLAAALPQIGRLGRGKVRFALRFVVPSLALGAAAGFHFLWHPSHWLLAKSVAKAAAASGWQVLMSPVGLLLPLAVLAWIEWRILCARRRAKEPAETAKPRERTAAHRIPVALRLLLRGAAFAILGLLLVLFAGLHAAWGMFRWQARHALLDKPNIIFIMVDTLRADHLGCYGYDLPTTPNIDRFAQEATLFEHPIAQSSFTPWSVHSLFTSQYPDVVFNAHQDLQSQLQLEGMEEIGATYGAPLSYVTLAEVLRDRGYSTSAVVSNTWLGATPGNAQGYDSYNDAPAKVNDECRETSPHVTRAALDRVRQVKDERFFLYLLYMDPHFPYHQNPGFTFDSSKRDSDIEGRLAHTVAPPQLVERRESLRRYDSEIAYTDHAIGQFLDELKRQGLYDDALIVFFSDHGEEFREHRGVGHRETVYQEVIHVPLIVKLPRQRAGRVVRGAVPLIDLVPSLLSYLGYPRERFEMRGDAIDLAGVLRCADKPIYSSTESTAKCIISGQRKFVRTSQATEEYFDLEADPLEQRNLLPRDPVEAQPLIAALDAWDKHNAILVVLHAGRGAGRDRTAQMPDRKSLIKRLQAIGYLQ